MGLTTFGVLFLTGAALSLRFTVLILFPATVVATICVAALGYGIAGLMLVPAALQVGYLVGLFFLPTFASWAVPGVWALGDHKWRRRDGGMQSAK
jgi:hypothetical protein